MQYRTLGKSGLSVSVISLGCEGFSGKTAGQVKTEIDFAISQGINFIDIYSSDPTLRTNIGLAIAPVRDRFYIQSHLCSIWENGQYRRTRDIDRVKSGFTEMLQQLGTNYIDVGMIHYVDNIEDFHTVFDGDIIRYATQLKREGIIKSIGMSSHNPVVAQMAVESGQIDVLLFSINPCYDMQPPTEDVEELWNEKNYEHALHNIAPEREALYEACERNGVGIDVMKAFSGGDLLSNSGSPFGKGFSTVQCIEYALGRPAVAAVMAGCKSMDEIKEAVHWCEATPAERDYTAALSTLGKFTWQGHCMYCGHCAPCSSYIDIALVNKYYNLAVGKEKIPETVREHYKALAHHASECIACGNCESRCPFGVSIVERMEKAAELFGY